MRIGVQGYSGHMLQVTTSYPYILITPHVTLPSYLIGYLHHPPLKKPWTVFKCQWNLQELTTALHLLIPRSCAWVSDVECEVTLNRDMKAGEKVKVKLGKVCLQAKASSVAEPTVEELEMRKQLEENEQVLKKELEMRRQLEKVIEQCQKKRKRRQEERMAMDKELKHSNEALRKDVQEKEAIEKELEEALKELAEEEELKELEEALKSWQRRES